MLGVLRKIKRNESTINHSNYTNYYDNNIFKCTAGESPV
jgi:hypothetical protein